MVKNYFYNLLLTLANLIFPVISFPYVSRVLGPEGIGKAQFVFSFSLYFGLIAAIGIPVYGMKEISRYKDDREARSKVFSELITIYVISSIILTFIYLAIVFIFPYFAVNREMYLAAMLMVLLGFANTEWVFTGMEQFKSIALRSVMFKIVGLVLLFVFIKQRGDFRYYLYFMMFPFLANNVLSLFLLKDKVRFRLHGLELRKHVMPLLFILGTGLAASMYTDMDTVLVGFLTNSKTVGLYTAAVKLSKISIPFVTSMATILLPKIAKDFGDSNLKGVQETLNQTFRFIMFFGVPIVFGLALLAPEFISLFSGREFLPATDSMRLLALLPLIIGLGNLYLYLILIPAGKNKEMFLCVLGGLFTSMLLNVVLTPSLKVMGSSIANVCSEIVVTLLYVYFIKKYFSFHYNWLLLVKSAGSALIFFPVVWLVKSLNLQLGFMLVLSIAGCGAAYFTIQLFIFRNTFVYDILNFVKLKLNITAK